MNAKCGSLVDARRVFDEMHERNVVSWNNTLSIGARPALCQVQNVKMQTQQLEKSKFEFQLRLQEFIELVRADNNMRAISYARKYLGPWGATHMKELQRVMATLAFRSNIDCPLYKVLFEVKQWDYLADQFKQEFCKLYGMTLEPLLNIYLQAGLSALKTLFCYEDDCTKDDPLS